MPLPVDKLPEPVDDHAQRAHFVGGKLFSGTAPRLGLATRSTLRRRRTIPSAQNYLCRVGPCHPDRMSVWINDADSEVQHLRSGTLQRAQHPARLGDLFRHRAALHRDQGPLRSEEHTSELQSLMRISYAVFCLNKQQYKTTQTPHTQT